MSDNITTPVVAEDAYVVKKQLELERIRVHTSFEENDTVVHDRVHREYVDVTRIPKNEEVADVPSVRVEGDTTIVPVIEERLIVEKRLFLIEEIHLRRTEQSEEIALPTTLRRTRIEIERDDLGAGEH